MSGVGCLHDEVLDRVVGDQEPVELTEVSVVGVLDLVVQVEELLFVLGVGTGTFTCGDDHGVVSVRRNGEFGLGGFTGSVTGGGERHLLGAVPVVGVECEFRTVHDGEEVAARGV